MIRFYLKRSPDGLYVQAIIPSHPSYGQRTEAQHWRTMRQAGLARERLCSLGYARKDEIKIVKVRTHPLPVIDRRCEVIQEDNGTILLKFRAIPGYAALELTEARLVAQEIMALVSVPW